MGTVEALAPIPIPRRRRVTKSCCQFWQNADPMTGIKQKMAEKNITPRRPKMKLSGSDSQHPLYRNVNGRAREVICPRLQQSRSDIWATVDDTNDPGIVIGCIISRVRDAELDWPGKVRSVGTSLIPSLYSSADGAENNGEVEGPWLAPFVEDFVAESVFLNLVQQLNRLESWRILRDESTFSKQAGLLRHPDLHSEVVDTLEQSFTRDAGQGILDAARTLLSIDAYAIFP